MSISCTEVSDTVLVNGQDNWELICVRFRKLPLARQIRNNRAEMSASLQAQQKILPFSVGEATRLSGCVRTGRIKPLDLAIHLIN